MIMTIFLENRQVVLKSTSKQINILIIDLIYLEIDKVNGPHLIFNDGKSTCIMKV